MIPLEERSDNRYPVLKFLTGMPGYVGRSSKRKLRRRMKPDVNHLFDKCVSKLTEDDICIDFGANVGKYTKILAASGATVHAFEPDPNTFQELVRNVGHLKNVVLHNKAVGFKSGDAPFYRHDDYDPLDFTRSGSSSIVYQSEKKVTNFVTNVEISSFEDFIRSLDKHVRLIKMDIEGAEFDILRDLFANKKFDLFDAMFVETHERFDPSEEPAFQEYRNIVWNMNHPLINLDWR